MASGNPSAPESPWQLPINTLPEIGCDVAHFGDDWTAIHVRWGAWSMHHERHSGWTFPQTAQRLKQLAREWCEAANGFKPGGSAPWQPERLLVKIDGDGMGQGVLDLRDDYNFVSVCASSRAWMERDYPNRRSELWFDVAKLARAGAVHLNLLTQSDREVLRAQAMAPRWAVNSQGQCQVEPKKDMKKRLGFSPDDMDSLNLAYARAAIIDTPSSIPDPPRPTTDHGFRMGKENSARPRKRLFGS